MQKILLYLKFSERKNWERRENWRKQCQQLTQQCCIAATFFLSPFAWKSNRVEWSRGTERERERRKERGVHTQQKCEEIRLKKKEIFSSPVVMATPLTCYSIGSAQPSVLSQPPQEYEHESRQSIAPKIYHAAALWGRLLLPYLLLPFNSQEKGREVTSRNRPCLPYYFHLAFPLL